MYDTIIIGAGAAGLMTAITAARNGVKVLLLDGQKKIGAKILMSGGTRCNVTNKQISEKDYNSHQLMRVRNILRGFDNKQTLEFFNALGVELVLESTGDWGKYFPVTNSGKTVLDALLKACAQHKVEVKPDHKVMAVTCAAGVFTVQGEGFSYQAPCVVLTTGGLSYPTTGSDGVGYRIARGFGHSIVPTTPALTPLLTNDADLKTLSGISLPVALMLYSNGKKVRTILDDFLFTHLGFSGPAALDISRHWLAAKDTNAQIFVNFLPSETQESFDALLQTAIQKSPKKSLKNFLCGFLPERLALVLLTKMHFDGHKALCQLDRQTRQKVGTLCVNYPLACTGVVGYSKAEVTAGGVDLAEVNPKNLESNHQPGLYFAGEILDVDGRIGGFNFQWAWASGFAVGTALAKTVKERAS
jgi:predicted Rossmann fold flavoprotein